MLPVAVLTPTRRAYIAPVPLLFSKSLPSFVVVSCCVPISHAECSFGRGLPCCCICAHLVALCQPMYCRPYRPQCVSSVVSVLSVSPFWYSCSFSASIAAGHCVLQARCWHHVCTSQFQICIALNPLWRSTVSKFSAFFLCPSFSALCRPQRLQV